MNQFLKYDPLKLKKLLYYSMKIINKKYLLKVNHFKNIKILEFEMKKIEKGVFSIIVE